MITTATATVQRDVIVQAERTGDMCLVVDNRRRSTGRPREAGRITHFAGILLPLLLVAACGASKSTSGRPSVTSRRDERSSATASRPAAGWAIVDLSRDLGASPQLGQSYATIRQASCTAGTFCMLVSDSAYVTYNGHSFSAARPLPNGTSILRSVSCASSTFCVALGDNGDYTTWDGSTWHAQTSAVLSNGSSTSRVVCPAQGFCLAIGQNGDQGPSSVWTYSGSSWTSEPMSNGGQVLDALACASRTYCHIVTGDGGVLTYDGHTWTGPTQVTIADDQNAADPIASSGVSCAPGPLCIGSASLTGITFIDTGSGFRPFPGRSPQSVIVVTAACGSAHFCVDLKNDGSYTVFDGTAWSTPLPSTASGFLLISCTAGDFCLAWDRGQDADVAVYSGSGTSTSPRPASSLSPSCITADDARSISGLSDVTAASVVRCENGWADVKFEQKSGTSQAVFHLDGLAWTFVTSAASYRGLVDACNTLATRAAPRWVLGCDSVSSP